MSQVEAIIVCMNKGTTYLEGQTKHNRFSGPAEVTQTVLDGRDEGIDFLTACRADCDAKFCLTAVLKMSHSIELNECSARRWHHHQVPLKVPVGEIGTL
jgi:hypothetical protein